MSYGFTRVAETPEELAEWAAAHPNRPEPSTHRHSCDDCGHRIWGSGFAMSAHRKACQGRPGTQTVAAERLPHLGGGWEVETRMGWAGMIEARQRMVRSEVLRGERGQRPRRAVIQRPQVEADLDTGVSWAWRPDDQLRVRPARPAPR